LSICLEFEKQEYCEYTIAFPPFQVPVSREARSQFFAGCSTFTAADLLECYPNQSFNKKHLSAYCICILMVNDFRRDEHQFEEQPKEWKRALG